MHPPTRTLYYSLNINNLGNTPARLVSIKLHYSLPQGWSRDEVVKIDGKKVTPVEPTLPGDIGPKLSVKYEHRAGFKLSPEAYKIAIDSWSKLFSQGFGIDAENLFRMIGTLEYTDVFNARHVVRWCWVEPLLPSEDPVEPSEYPADCVLKQ